MATHFFHGEIKQESVINTIGLLEKDEDTVIDLYFSSGGGDLTMAEVFIDFLGITDKQITLIGHWNLFSAALEIYCRAACTKRLLSDAYGMVHLADRDVSVKDCADKNSRDYFLIKEAVDYNNQWISDHRSFFTRKEVSFIKRGGDLYMDHERLLRYVDQFAYQPPAIEKVQEPKEEELPW